MKILPDECVTKRLKKHLEEFEVLDGKRIGIGWHNRCQLCPGWTILI